MKGDVVCYDLRADRGNGAQSKLLELLLSDKRKDK